MLQKISDAPLSTCPECGKETFSKQLTAAGFQLKGSGYYVTDFKGGPKKPDSVKPEAKTDAVAVPASTASSPATGSAT
ncbi:MAG TPA: FmdB family zinc ribbon protein [Gallionella sp.]